MISIIIPTRNRPESLALVLDHLKRTAPPAQIVIVDDGSDIPIHPPDSPALLVRLPRQSGHAAARNAGARNATGSILVFLDDDMYPAPSAWEFLLSHLDEEIPTWVGPAVVAALPEETPEAARIETAPHLPSAMLVTRADTFAVAGEFDETLPRMVDFDLTFRARRMGHRLITDHRAVAAHLDVIHTFPQKVQRMHDWIELFPWVWARQGCPEEMMTDVGHDFFCPSLRPRNRALQLAALALQPDWAWRRFSASLPLTAPNPGAQRRIYSLAGARGALRSLRRLSPEQRNKLALECERGKDRRLQKAALAKAGADAR
ncbi:MAG: glycosyltransferase family 2 protein [Actinomycetota bacterium]